MKKQIRLSLPNSSVEATIGTISTTVAGLCFVYLGLNMHLTGT